MIKILKKQEFCGLLCKTSLSEEDD